MNSFLIISCFYNASEFIERCVGSILSQDYQNYRVLFVDDASTDGSLDLIDDDERFIKIRNEQNKGLLYNFATYLPKYAKAEDIIIVLDGDDALYNSKSLLKLDQFYQETSCLVSYGQSMWTNGKKGFARAYTKEEFKNLRKGPFICSHLRSFKYELFIEMINQDPNFDCYKDEKGNFLMMAGDVAVMYPILEIAGFENVKYNDNILYLYNFSNPISDHVKNQQLQWDCHRIISNKTPFKQRGYKS